MTKKKKKKHKQSKAEADSKHKHRISSPLLCAVAKGHPSIYQATPNAMEQQRITNIHARHIIVNHTPTTKPNPTAASDELEPGTTKVSSEHSGV